VNVLTFDVLTLSPAMFLGPLAEGMLARARRSGHVAVRVHDLRRWGVGAHRQVDDAPYGGGEGMILRPEPLFEAVDWLRLRFPEPPARVVLLSPRGRRLDHGQADRLASSSRIVLLCGRYEGVDERVRQHLADEELSVGDYVLTGGELPAMTVIDAVIRFVPGVLGSPGAAGRDSFANGWLESPYYTRPASYRGLEVPGVLLSGDHEAVARWRDEQSRRVTRGNRPDLVEGGSEEGAPGGGAEGRDGRHS
jgi:tRNA (guanine37-N1)-methyltransferase